MKLFASSISPIIGFAAFLSGCAADPHGARRVIESTDKSSTRKLDVLLETGTNYPSGHRKVTLDLPLSFEHLGTTATKISIHGKGYIVGLVTPATARDIGELDQFIADIGEHNTILIKNGVRSYEVLLSRGSWRGYCSINDAIDGTGSTISYTLSDGTNMLSLIVIATVPEQEISPDSDTFVAATMEALGKSG